jgi:uncharacterized protein
MTAKGSAGRAAPSRALLINAAELLRRPGSERDLDVELSAAELGLADPRFRPDDRVGVALRLESLNDGIVVLGSIDVPWHGSCRRCLRPLDEHTRSDVDELYQSVVTHPDAFEIVGDQLDLLPMVRELALLDAPESPLCRPDCAGLCPVCGVDLNETTCSCEAPVQSSPWDVLDSLKAQLDDN